MKTQIFLQKVLIENSMKKSRKNLYKYNSDKNKYNIENINDIIYDDEKHLVSVFKDFLLWDESSDFLRRYYTSIKKVLLLLRELYENTENR
jgi:hypothetical protein